MVQEEGVPVVYGRRVYPGGTGPGQYTTPGYTTVHTTGSSSSVVTGLRWWSRKNSLGSDPLLDPGRES